MNVEIYYRFYWLLDVLEPRHDWNFRFRIHRHCDTCCLSLPGTYSLRTGVSKAESTFWSRCWGRCWGYRSWHVFWSCSGNRLCSLRKSDQISRTARFTRILSFMSLWCR